MTKKYNPIELILVYNVTNFNSKKLQFTTTLVVAKNSIFEET